MGNACSSVILSPSPTSPSQGSGQATPESHTYTEVGKSPRVGDTLNDESRRVSKVLFTCMVEPLRWRDFEVIWQVRAASMAIDERDGVLLMYAGRYLESREVYNTFLVRPAGTTPEHIHEAIKAIVRQACTVRIGRQGHVDKGHAHVDKFRGAVVSVADGGLYSPVRKLPCEAVCGLISVRVVRN